MKHLALSAWFCALFIATPAYSADPQKTLRVAFLIAETGFDPQAVSDIYSSYVNRAIFEPLYVYHYLQRPYKLIPLVAESLPEISEDGKTWTIKLKRGIYFTDDPAFKGQRRELTAEDFVFAWKRLIDPKVISPYLYFLEGKIVGAAPLVEAARKSGKFDYDAPLEGLRAVDRYTIRLQLLEPDYVLLQNMTHYAMAPVAREVIEAYGDPNNTWAMANPIGTGPYVLKEWRRGQRIILEANPAYREDYFPDSDDPGDRTLLATMKGKRIPQIGRIDIQVIEESNPHLLAFKSKAIDIVDVPRDLQKQVVEGDKLLPEYASQGLIHGRLVLPALQYAYFNMDDPIVGGYSKEKIALRRAMIMGYNTDEEIKVRWHGQASPASQPIPPSSIGHDRRFPSVSPYDVDVAKALLDKFGYLDRDGDGYREMPDGKPLTIIKASVPTALDRILDELWEKHMKTLGIRMEFLKQKWPDLLKMGRAGKLQMWGVGWYSTITDGETFLGLLYSKRIGQSNYSRFKLPEYDRLFEQAKLLPDSPQRTELYRRMSELVAVYAPWDFGVYRIENTIAYPWLIGYKKHAFYNHLWKYLDIDLPKQQLALKN